MVTTEADILAAALLSKAAHDLRNKTNMVVGASDLLELESDSSAEVALAREVLGDGETEMRELAQRWGAASTTLYEPIVTTISVRTLLANLEARIGTPTRFDLSASLTVRCDERVFNLLVARLSRRLDVDHLVARREDNYGISWLVLEGVSSRGSITHTVDEDALFRMLDAHALVATRPGVFAFRLRLS